MFIFIIQWFYELYGFFCLVDVDVNETKRSKVRPTSSSEPQNGESEGKWWPVNVLIVSSYCFYR